MRRVLLLVMWTVVLAGCTSLFQEIGGQNKQRQGVSSSLVDFLYPNGEEPPKQDNVVPELTLPVRVGLAFVPARDGSTAPGLSQANKQALLDKVKAAFAGREFIREITVIPDTYLRARGGFGSIEQVARLYGLDVIALVSYDQMAHTDDTRMSLLYWTIVGAYLVKGSKNDVQTFVDAAVFDVKTRKLLLRAPGTDRIESTSTLINSPEETRKAREHSFANAMGDMTGNLDKELDAFRARIKTDRSVIVTQSPAGGSRGGSGAVGLWGLVALLVAASIFPLARRP